MEASTSSDQDGGDFPPGATKARKANGDQPPAQAFPVIWVNDAKLDLSARPLLKGLIDPGAFVVIYGPPGSGKSFFTADIAQHIATGENWRGRKVRQSLVVYIASEAGRSILKRFIAWRDNRTAEVSVIPLAILTRGPNLLASMDVEKLTVQLRELCVAAQLPLGMGIFDTLSRSIPGGDENKSEDMTMVVAAADAFRAEFGAATVYVHHSGKDTTKGARGHSALHAAADLVMLVEDRVATVEKVRDGVAGERFTFSLEPVELGLDADGDPVTTCLLTPTDTAIPVARKDPSGKNQRMFYKELRQLVLDQGQLMPETSVIPKGSKSVSYASLVDRMLPKMPDLKPFTARQRLSSAAISLQESGYVGVHGDMIWLT